MTGRRFQIENIHAVLYGDGRQSVPVCPRSMRAQEEDAAFAEIACPAGVQVLAVDLPEHGERQDEENRFNPWTAVLELKTVFADMKSRWREIRVRANSVGAHFSMLALGGENLCKALFVSPIVDMERPIAILYAGRDNMTSRQTVEGLISEIRHSPNFLTH